MRKQSTAKAGRRGSAAQNQPAGKTSKLQREIERAEARVTLDLTLAARQREAGARAVLALINNADVPDFISDHVIDAITKAGMKAGCETPDAFRMGREQIKQLARLFAWLPPDFDSEETFILALKGYAERKGVQRG